MATRADSWLFGAVAGVVLSCIYSCFKLIHNLYVVAPSFAIPGGESGLFHFSFGSLSVGYLLCLLCCALFRTPAARRAIAVGGSATFVLGTTVASAAGTALNLPLFCTGTVVGQVGAAFTLVRWIELLAAVPDGQARRIALIQVAATLACLFSYLLPHALRLALCLLLPVACVGGLAWCRRTLALDRPEAPVTVHETHATDKGAAPSTYVRAALAYDPPLLRHMLYIGLGIGAVWVCIGFSRAIVNADLGVDALARNLIWGEVLACLAAAVVAATHSDHLFQRAFKGIVFLSMFGFLFLYLPLENNAYLGGIPIAAASSFCQTIAMLFAATIARKHHGPAGIPGAGFFIFLSGGLAVGMSIARAMLIEGFGPGTDYYAFISTGIVMVLAVAALWLFGEHGIDLLLWSKTPEGPTSRPSGSSDAASGLARSLAACFGLTAREEEVLCLVLTGRTTTYISETLSISRNTVNTHIRHLYQKIGIHDRQELLDYAYKEHGEGNR